MVTVFLRGGLGNQMFQYATGLAVAEKKGTDLLLDTVFLNDRFPRKNFTYRTYDLDIFTAEPKLTALSHISSAIPIPGVWLGIDLVLMKAKSATGVRRIVKEQREFVFDQRVFAAKGDVVLWGRWQNEKYFSDIERDIRAAFAFRNPLSGEAAKIAEDIRSSDSVSMHVRRGDFVALKNVAQMMGETNLSYYEQATKYVAARVSKPKLFVFSDDIEWCRENIKLPVPTVFVPASAEGPKAAFHLELMSLCKHNIIANSTFSWWGAWLNTNTQKIVVAPQRWYADGRDGKNEIMPEEWIKM